MDQGEGFALGLGQSWRCSQRYEQGVHGLVRRLNDLDTPFALLPTPHLQ